MKIVVLDGYTVNPGDLSWGPIEAFGDVTIHDRTNQDQIVSRAKNAETLIVNKNAINAAHLDQLPNLQLICLLATGYDNVDVEAAKSRGIHVYNAVGYGVESVAQHTLALMLALTNKVESHHQSVLAGDWAAQSDFSYSILTVQELKGKVCGVLGLGQIGSRVAELANAFGMQVVAPDRPSLDQPKVRGITQERLFAESDIISLHLPLNQSTQGIINASSLAQMKPNALIVNTGRGGLIVEKDLAEALQQKHIAGAALDVLSVEPPRDRNILLQMPNVIITPHMAWRSEQARRRLIDIVAGNIQSYLDQEESENRIV